MMPVSTKVFEKMTTETPVTIVIAVLIVILITVNHIERRIANSITVLKERTELALNGMNTKIDAITASICNIEDVLTDTNVQLWEMDERVNDLDGGLRSIENKMNTMQDEMNVSIIDSIKKYDDEIKRQKSDIEMQCHRIDDFSDRIREIQVRDIQRGKDLSDDLSLGLRSIEDKMKDRMDSSITEAFKKYDEAIGCQKVDIESHRHGIDDRIREIQVEINQRGKNLNKRMTLIDAALSNHSKIHRSVSGCLETLVSKQLYAVQMWKSSTLLQTVYVSASYLANAFVRGRELLMKSSIENVNTTSGQNFFMKVINTNTNDEITVMFNGSNHNTVNTHVGFPTTLVKITPDVYASFPSSTHPSFFALISAVCKSYGVKPHELDLVDLVTGVKIATCKGYSPSGEPVMVAETAPVVTPADTPTTVTK